MARIVWSVYLARWASNGEEITPMRMICSGEEDARRELSKHGTVAIGREEVWEVAPPQQRESEE